MCLSLDTEDKQGANGPGHKAKDKVKEDKLQLRASTCQIMS